MTWHVFCRDLIPGLAVRWQAGDHPLLKGGPCLPEQASVYLPGGCRPDFYQKHQACCRGLDGRVQKVLLPSHAARKNCTLWKVSDDDGGGDAVSRDFFNEPKYSLVE